MASKAEFERRQREREKQNRMRMRKIRTVILGVLLLAVIIIIVVSVRSCSKNNEQSQTQQNYVSENVDNKSGESAVIETEEPRYGNPEGVKDIPAAADVNNLLDIIKKSPSEKYCYLAFDDGPSEEVTPMILDVLRRYNIKATFFEIGSYIEEFPDIARRVYEEGHLIGVHSYSHNYKKFYGSEDSFKSEVETTYELIKNITGDTGTFKLMRFPGGSFNSGDYASVKQSYKETLKNIGFYYADWNASGADADTSGKSTQQIIDYFKANKPSGSIVVHLHDSSGKKTTAEALGSIIDYLISEGYTFHRLDDIPYTPSTSTAAPQSSDSSDSSDSSSND